MTALVWFGLSMHPNLWMLMTWMVAAALWSGARLLRVKATSFQPSFWSNALVTMLILLGPAIQDSAVGEDVLSASAVRVTLFVGVAPRGRPSALERWRASRSKAVGRIAVAG